MTELAEALNKHFGYTFTQSNLSRKLSADTVKWSELRDIAKLLGYSIKISPVENWESLETYSPHKESAGITTVL